MTTKNNPEPPKNEASKTELKEAELPKNDIVEKLEKAAKNLVFISETDAPLTPFFWPADKEGDNQKLSADFVAAQAGMPANAKTETRTLDEFFRASTTLEDWMNDEEKTEVKRFQELKKTLEDNLKNISVFRFGETKIDVFIIGQTAGGFAGVQTKVVET